MLNFDDIISTYPKRLQGFKKNILKEYLQYKILDIIFSSKNSGKLTFIGGTAIRIVHDSSRFSEDLDFDSQGLSWEKFEQIGEIIKYQLELDGLVIEIENVKKTAFHCYIKFPELLFKMNLSGYKQEKILITLDSEPQDYIYQPDKYLINRFGIFRYINVPSVPLLLSQKITALLNRKREKGRDFFDVVYLMGKTQPDYGFLTLKTGIKSKQELISQLEKKVKTLDLPALAKDVEPFLIETKQKDRVIYFDQWLKTLK